MQPDRHRHRQIASGRLRLRLDDAQVLWRHHPDPSLGRSGQHHPVEGHVARSRLRVVRDHHARREVWPRVLLRVDDERERAQVDGIALVDDLLHRRRVDAHRLDAALERLAEAPARIARLDAEGEPDRRACPEEVVHERRVGAAHALEEDREAAQLRLPHQPRSLGRRVDLAAGPREQSALVELSEERAEVGRHRPGSYD